MGSVFGYGYSLSRSNEVKDLFESVISVLETLILTDETKILLGLLLDFRAMLEQDLAHDSLLIEALAKKAFALVSDLAFKFDVAYVIAFSIGAFGYVVEDSPNRERWLNECLRCFREVGARYQEVVTLINLGQNIAMSRDAVEGTRIVEESIAMLKQQGDVALRARFHRYASNLPQLSTARTIEHLEISTDLWYEVGNRMQIGLNLDLLASKYIYDAPEIAEMYFFQALEVGRELGNTYLISVGMNCLAETRVAQGDIATARRLHLERLEFCEKHGLKGPMNYALVQLGKLAQSEGNIGQAEGYFRQAEAKYVEIGWLSTRMLVRCTLILMWLEQTPPEIVRADLDWFEMRQLFSTIRFPTTKLFVVLTQAHRLAAREQVEQAIELCGLIINSPFNGARFTDYSPTRKERAELLLQRIQADLSPDVVEAALQRGAALDLDEVFQSLMD